MGCQSSKLDFADDSIHVMLAHAAAHSDGHSKSSYVPRQPHPLIKRAEQQTSTAIASDTDSESMTEIDRLLYHAAHHNDTIDPRDLEDYGISEDDEQ